MIVENRKGVKKEIFLLAYRSIGLKYSYWLILISENWVSEYRKNMLQPIKLIQMKFPQELRTTEYFLHISPSAVKF